MFRFSLLLFGAIVLLGLALTIGYALFGFGGPHSTIERARELYAQGEYLQVVKELDRNESGYSLQRDPPKRRELLRLRYKAHMELGNDPAARRDLERLLAQIREAASQEPAEEFLLDHVRLLALTGDGEQALLRARDFLGKNPDHGRALELAGEAGQSVYRDELRAIIETLQLDLGAPALPVARRNLLAFLYRPDADAEVRQAIEALRESYSAQSRLVAAWPGLLRRIERLRERVQESLGYFQRSLELGDQPVAAFRGLALSLQESDRIDDLLLLCEIYRRRYDHLYVAEAGATAAWTLARFEQNRGAIATAQRWVPPGTGTDPADAERLGPALAKLFTARILAAWRLRDRSEFGRIWRDIRPLNELGLIHGPANPLLSGFNSKLADRIENSEEPLERASRWLRPPPQLGQTDLLAVVMAARLDNLQQLGSSEAVQKAAIDDWIKARPTAIEPLLARASLQVRSGKVSGAMATVQAAQKLAPDDESLLALRVEIAANLYRETDQDGPGLLAQCQRRQELVPEVPDPVCYLLCGEAALRVDVPEVAIACGRAATDAMPHFRAGRLLEARAELAANNPRVAAEILSKVLTSAALDSETIELALQVHRRDPSSGKTSGWPDGLLRDAVRCCAPSDDLAADLLRALRHDAPPASLPLARTLLQRGQDDAPPIELCVLGSAAFARAGEVGPARRLLARAGDALAAAQKAAGSATDGSEGTAPNSSDPNATQPGSSAPEPLADELQVELTRAAASLLRVTADRGATDADLSKQVDEWRCKFGLRSAAAAVIWLELAREVAETHPQTSYELVTGALAAADPEHRTGQGYALAGDLALRLGYHALAESHWTAALAFPDGRTAAEPLARLCLATDRTERALQVYRLATDASDPALALRCGNLEGAKQLIETTLTRDAGDLLTQVTITAANLPSLLQDLTPETQAERDALLELASILREPQLAKYAMARAIAWAEQKPSPTATLILARAHRESGNFAQVSKFHRELWARDYRILPFWSEVATACVDPAYEPAAAVNSGLSAAAVKGELATSPFAYAIGIHRLADAVTSAGHEELALGYRTSAWLQYTPELQLPPACRPTVANAESLLAAGRDLDAWWLLDRLRPTVRPKDRVRLVNRMLAIGSRLLADENPDTTSQRRTVYGAILALIAEEGPFGAAVHAALAHADGHPELAPTAKQRYDLLTGHLEIAASAQDDNTRVASSVDQLLSAHGHGPTLEALERTLARHPLAIELWHQRSRVLRGMRRGTDGIADFRAALAHIDAPAKVVELTAGAALEYLLTPADIEAFRRVGKELRESSRGQFVNGLIELRRGQADAAVPLLESTRDSAGPEGLVALAQALLQSNLEDAEERAREVLDALTTDHASSSAARYAGSFSRQLAPR
ncbi:MAG: hypothetical protein NXI31_22660 [bacterium]|nr:hypothetical protein [bacterium]